MAKMRFGKLEIDPVNNPAVLDTATWDPERAWDIVSSLNESYWLSVEKASKGKSSLPVDENCIAYMGSWSAGQYGGSNFFLARLRDGQHVFIEIGVGDGAGVLGEPTATKILGDANRVRIYKTDAAVVERYVRLVKPEKGPKALGAIPRLGVGSRMSTAVWPGVWAAMDKYSFAANAIQNSMREVNVLEDVLAGRPPRTNYQFGFGTIEEGHTGSTFEGLWVAGVLEALKTDTLPAFGADADHIMVKRGAEGIGRAKRVLEAARNYTFFTLDVGDILDYGAETGASDCAGKTFLTERIEQVEDRRAVLAYHSQKHRIGGHDYHLDEASIGRLTSKYWAALNAAEQLCRHIESLKIGAPFDLELSIDEHPPDVGTFDCLTSEVELAFLILEMQRRRIPLTHIAPNLGIEKGRDYRGSDALPGLERRIRGLHQIAAECGIMLDCHSGDDLEPATRQVIGRATKGQIHFKVSPALQVLFAEVLHDVAKHAVFHHFCFASVGRRDANGQFVNRERFYDLSPDFYREYRSRVTAYLCDVADDVLVTERMG